MGTCAVGERRSAICGAGVNTKSTPAPNDDKKEINAAIGKYTATALKCGVSDSLKQIDALLKQVPSAIDTALEGAKGFFEELGN